jgi:hypothetical protein
MNFSDDRDSDDKTTNPPLLDEDKEAKLVAALKSAAFVVSPVPTAHCETL